MMTSTTCDMPCTVREYAARAHRADGRQHVYGDRLAVCRGDACRRRAAQHVYAAGHKRRALIVNLHGDLQSKRRAELIKRLSSGVMAGGMQEVKAVSARRLPVRQTGWDIHAIPGMGGCLFRLCRLAEEGLLMVQRDGTRSPRAHQGIWCWQPRAAGLQGVHPLAERVSLGLIPRLLQLDRPQPLRQLRDLILQPRQLRLQQADHRVGMPVVGGTAGSLASP